MANQRVRKNFLKGSLSQAIDANVQTLESSAFVNLPVITASQRMFITLDPGRDAGEPEIVDITFHTNGSTGVTCIRGVQGSSAREHVAGTLWKAAATAEDFNATSKLEVVGTDSASALLVEGKPTISSTSDYSALQVLSSPKLGNSGSGGPSSPGVSPTINTNTLYLISSSQPSTIAPYIVRGLLISANGLVGDSGSILTNPIVYGGEIKISPNSATRITNSVGLYINNDGAVGGIDNMTAILINNLSGTEKWGLQVGQYLNQFQGQVVIGGVTIDTKPNSFASLDLQHTDKAFIVNRLTTSQRETLTPTNGMIIYNTTNRSIESYVNGAWVSLIDFGKKEWRLDSPSLPVKFTITYDGTVPSSASDAAWDALWALVQNGDSIILPAGATIRFDTPKFIDKQAVNLLSTQEGPWQPMRNVQTLDIGRFVAGADMPFLFCFDGPQSDSERGYNHVKNIAFDGLGRCKDVVVWNNRESSMVNCTVMGLKHGKDLTLQLLSTGIRVGVDDSSIPTNSTTDVGISVNNSTFTLPSNFTFDSTPLKAKTGSINDIFSIVTGTKVKFLRVPTLPQTGTGFTAVNTKNDYFIRRISDTTFSIHNTRENAVSNTSPYTPTFISIAGSVNSITTGSGNSVVNFTSNNSIPSTSNSLIGLSVKVTSGSTSVTATITANNQSSITVSGANTFNNLSTPLTYEVVMGQTVQSTFAISKSGTAQDVDIESCRVRGETTTAYPSPNNIDAHTVFSCGIMIYKSADCSIKNNTKTLRVTVGTWISAATCRYIDNHPFSGGMGRENFGSTTGYPGDGLTFGGVSNPAVGYADLIVSGQTHIISNNYFDNPGSANENSSEEGYSTSSSLTELGQAGAHIILDGRESWVRGTVIANNMFNNGDGGSDCKPAIRVRNSSGRVMNVRITNNIFRSMSDLLNYDNGVSGLATSGRVRYTTNNQTFTFYSSSSSNAPLSKHGLKQLQPIEFDAVPQDSGVSTNTVYYVKRASNNLNLNTFQIFASRDSTTPVNIANNDYSSGWQISGKRTSIFQGLIVADTWTNFTGIAVEGNTAQWIWDPRYAPNTGSGWTNPFHPYVDLSDPTSRPLPDISRNNIFMPGTDIDSPGTADSNRIFDTPSTRISLISGSTLSTSSAITPTFLEYQQWCRTNIDLSFAKEVRVIGYIFEAESGAWLSVRYSTNLGASWSMLGSSSTDVNISCQSTGVITSNWIPIATAARTASTLISFGFIGSGSPGSPTCQFNNVYLEYR